MNSTSTRTIRYAGAGIVTAAASIGFATPALAMIPPGPPAPPLQTQTSPTGDSAGAAATEAVVAESGIDWATMSTGLAIGAGFTGAVVVVGLQSRRRHPNPA